jgi:hypothetical protein
MWGGNENGTIVPTRERMWLRILQHILPEPSARVVAPSA